MCHSHQGYHLLHLYMTSSTLDIAIQQLPTTQYVLINTNGIFPLNCCCWRCRYFSFVTFVGIYSTSRRLIIGNAYCSSSALAIATAYQIDSKRLISSASASAECDLGLLMPFGFSMW